METNNLLKKDSLKLNLFMQMFYQVLAVIVPLITTPYISRVLGADLIGQNSLATNIVSYFLLFSMLGLNTYSARIIPKFRDNKFELEQRITSLLVIHILFSLIALGGYYILISFVQPVDYYLLAIASIYILSSLLELNWLFAGLEQMKLSVLRNSLMKVITIILIFIFVKSKDDLWIYALILSGSGVICNFLLWGYLLKNVRFRLPSFSMLSTDLKELFILFLPSIALSLYRYIDKLFVGLMSSTTELGYYEQSEKIITVAVGLLSALGYASIPKFTTLWGKNGSTELIHKFNYLLSFLGCAIGFGIASISPLLAEIYLGEEFVPCENLLILLSISVLFMEITCFYRYVYLIPLGYDKEYTISTFAGAFVNLAIDLFLIPNLGALGAVIGTVITDFVVMILTMFFVRKKSNVFRELFQQLPFFIIGILMFIILRIFIYYTIPSWFCLLMAILLGVFVYFLFSFIYTIFFQKQIILYFKDFFKEKITP